MNVVIAIDSLKGSLTSLEAGNAAADGIRKVIPDADISVRPLADGGEGTVEALVFGMGGKMVETIVTGPVGQRVSCQYGMLHDGKTAVIEMAGAAGLGLVDGNERNPLHTTTYGVGEVIRDAIAGGCRHFIVGIGGSATNDGGIGMLQALGFEILDQNGEQVSFGAKGLKEIVSIQDDNVLPELRDCHFEIACDVTNPLCGENGCSAVYGPQKGASGDDVLQMDQWMEHYARIAGQKYPKADSQLAGAGAAGGLGFAFRTFTNAVLKSGIQIILEETRLEDHIKNADIVITGEGCLDRQSVFGKAPVGVAKIAKKHQKPVIAFSGCVADGASMCNEHGIDAFFPILRKTAPLAEVLEAENAKQNMKAAVEQVFRLIVCIGGGKHV